MSNDADGNSGTVSRDVTITNRLGLHARPAMSFVDEANKFDSEITVTKGAQSVNAKSIMHVMMLAATQGTKLSIQARGDDAQAAVDALASLIESGFDED